MCRHIRIATVQFTTLHVHDGVKHPLEVHAFPTRAVAFVSVVDKALCHVRIETHKVALYRVLDLLHGHTPVAANRINHIVHYHGYHRHVRREPVSRIRLANRLLNAAHIKGDFRPITLDHRVLRKAVGRVENTKARKSVSERFLYSHLRLIYVGKASKKTTRKCFLLGEMGIESNEQSKRISDRSALIAENTGKRSEHNSEGAA